MDPPAFALHLGEDFKTTNPLWQGNIVAFETSDPTGKIGHTYTHVTATNVNVLPTDTAPFDLSETPTDGTFNYLLEDGSGVILLEDGTDFAPAGSDGQNFSAGRLRIEGALAKGYKNLTIRKQINTIGTFSTIGRCRVHAAGLRPGNIFKLTSTNQGYAAFAFQINQASISWPTGKNPPIPVYDIEFGDTPQTLAQWTQISAPAPVVPVSAPVTITTGVTVYGRCTAGHKLWPQGGGVVTIASATFTISAPSGHTDTVQLVGQIDCRAYAWDNYVGTPRRAVRAVISGGVYTGAWQETLAGTSNSAGARATYDLSSAPAISLPDGTYTVSIQIDTQQFNQMEVFSAYAQAAVTVV